MISYHGYKQGPSFALETCHVKDKLIHPLELILALCPTVVYDAE